MTAKDDFDNFDEETTAVSLDDDADPVADIDGGTGKTAGSAAKGKLVLIGGVVVFVGIAGFVGLQMLGGSPNTAAKAPSPVNPAAISNANTMTPPAPAEGGNPLAANANADLPVTDTAGASPLGDMPAAIPSPSAPPSSDSALPSIDLAMPPAIIAPAGSGAAVPDISISANGASPEAKNIIAPMNPALAADNASDTLAPLPGIGDPNPAAPADLSMPAPIADTALAVPAPIAAPNPVEAIEPPLSGNQPSPPLQAVAGDLPVAPGGTEAVSSDLDKRLASLEAVLNDLSTSVATKKDIVGLESRLSALESKKSTASPVSRVTEDTYSSNEDTPAPAVKKSRPAKKAAVKPAKARTKGVAAIKAAPVTSQWVLKGARPGSAWLSEKGSNELRPVVVGETVPGIGKITTITKGSDGRWVVNGTKGRVNQ